MDDEPPRQNYYEVLHVHPAAPLELITGAYWWLINQEREAEKAGASTEAARHLLTKAYQTLADPALRRSHDASLGLPPQAPFPALPRRLREPPRRRRGLIARRPPAPEPEDPSVDYYEVLRVQPQAELPILALARTVVGNYYLRQVRFAEAPAGLIELLDEAYAALTDANGPEGDAASIWPTLELPEQAGTATPGPRSSESPLSRGRKALFRLKEAAKEAVETITARKPARPDGTAADQETVVLERLTRVREAVDLKTTGGAVAGPPPPPARLVVTGGPQTGKEFVLNGRPLTIGSAERYELVLTGIAPRQAWIWARDGRYILLNLQSEPALLHGGRPLGQATLEDGDLLTVGPHRLRFDLTA